MPSRRTYKLGDEFPSESFVQSAIEGYFRKRGFEIDTSGFVDLLCVHPVTGERWHIEAKGKTSDPGLDFRTCLGQLIQQITPAQIHYGIALPNIPAFAAQMAKIDPWVVKQLRIHWLRVSQDGDVAIDNPQAGIARSDV